MTDRSQPFEKSPSTRRFDLDQLPRRIVRLTSLCLQLAFDRPDVAIFLTDRFLQ